LAEQREAALAAIKRIEAMPGYRDKREPHHAELVEEASALYEQAYPSAAPPDAAVTPLAPTPRRSPVTPVQPRPGAVRDARAIQADKAYWNKADPRHQATVDEMARAYAAAYPEPLRDDAPPGTTAGPAASAPGHADAAR
jgi:hypothetical protein